jgi:putative sterol carrier protein
LDLKNGNGAVTRGDCATKADLTIKISDADFLELYEGRLNPQQAFMKGKIKTQGNMGMAMKLNTVISAARPKAKL